MVPPQRSRPRARGRRRQRGDRRSGPRVRGGGQQSARDDVAPLAPPPVDPASPPGHLASPSVVPTSPSVSAAYDLVVSTPSVPSTSSIIAGIMAFSPPRLDPGASLVAGSFLPHVSSLTSVGGQVIQEPEQVGDLMREDQERQAPDRYTPSSATPKEGITQEDVVSDAQRVWTHKPPDRYMTSLVYKRRRVPNA